MSLLTDIAADVQQVAEAIHVALGVEVEIVDDRLTIVGGTAIFHDIIGRKEESGRLSGDALYATMLRGGGTETIEDAPNFDRYGTSLAGVAQHSELAEICTPIRMEGRIIGIIGLVALTEEQKCILLDSERELVRFVEKLADLLAAKADLKAMLSERESQLSEMAAAFESVQVGILAFDRNGYIIHCNRKAAKLLGAQRDELPGSHITRFMKGANALGVLKTEKGYTECEEVYKSYQGTLHFIVSAKPWFRGGKIDGVVLSFRDLAEAQKLAYSMNTRALKYTFDDIIGDSPLIEKLKSQALIIARGGSTVLITGESGTGKEMFARAIHYSGPRAAAPFVTVNCGAIPEQLLESELFGYEKGAFTGADKQGKQGKFEAADGGTIFLDEIGDMPLHLQVKILHAIQNMRFERVGGNRTVLVDVRVIAATNRDIEEMIESGEFRSDLYYRLSVIPLHVPPLRMHPEDIDQLLAHFLHKYNSFMNRSITGFTDASLRLLREYAWPGNVRELENAVEYGVNMAQGSRIDMDSIPTRIRESFHSETGRGSGTEAGCAAVAAESTAAEAAETEMDGATGGTARGSPVPIREQVRRFEADLIRSKLEEYGDSSSVKEALAEELGISRATLYRRLAALKVESEHQH
ncbi:MAG: sigma 54-interacting transcriptional regulator [Clostridiales Family XIII bacterium]|jgi:PAS domain S-box-containing protein|nr:sigma 54-interacting transcriptional regulator [Clostridiales Family XIII bacterium]